MSGILTACGGLKENKPSKLLSFTSKPPETRMFTLHKGLRAVHLRDLTQCAYRFSWSQFVRHVKKNWMPFGALFMALYLADFEDLDESIRRQFDIVFSALLAIYKIIGVKLDVASGGGSRWHVE